MMPTVEAAPDTNRRDLVRETTLTLSQYNAQEGPVPGVLI